MAQSEAVPLSESTTLLDLARALAASKEPSLTLCDKSGKPVFHISPADVVAAIAAGANLKTKVASLPWPRQAALPVESGADATDAGNEALEAYYSNIEIVAHDLRSPLATVTACADFVIDEIKLNEDFDRDIVLDFLNRLRASAAFGLRLVRDVLDVRRLQVKGGLAVQEVELPQFARGLASSLKVAADKRDCKLIVAADEPIVGTFDPDRIAQAVTNLVENALKHTPAGRSIFISTGFLPDPVDPKSGKATIAVRDEGGGLAPERVRSLFEKYEQVEVTKAQTGVGLGLSIVWAFVKAHGGDVKVDTQPGAGATFTITLPVARRGRVSGASVVKEQKVLVVEDDPDIAMLVCEWLQQAGFKVEYANDGETGFKKFQSFQPDVVISDVRMPGLDGFQLLSQIRADRPQTCVFLMSGFFPNLNEKRLRSAFSADRFFEKPVELEALLTAIRECSARTPVEG